VGDIATPLLKNHEFITACARYAEGLLSEAQVKKRFRFDDETWDRLGSNEPLIEAIEAEKERRIRSGVTARERAQVLFAQAPQRLGDIMNDDGTSPRHRIESARELRQIADSGKEAASASASDRFQIIINLGDDVLKFDKSIEINPNDTDPHNTDTTPQGLLPIIAAKKRDGGDGEPI
jgi:hypothetical protein